MVEALFFSVTCVLSGHIFLHECQKAFTTVNILTQTPRAKPGFPAGISHLPLLSCDTFKGPQKPTSKGYIMGWETVEMCLMVPAAGLQNVDTSSSVLVWILWPSTSRITGHVVTCFSK